MDGIPIHGSLRRCHGNLCDQEYGFPHDTVVPCNRPGIRVRRTLEAAIQSFLFSEILRPCVLEFYRSHPTDVLGALCVSRHPRLDQPVRYRSKITDLHRVDQFSESIWRPGVHNANARNSRLVTLDCVQVASESAPAPVTHSATWSPDGRHRQAASGPLASFAAGPRSRPLPQRGPAHPPDARSTRSGSLPRLKKRGPYAL